MSRIVPFPGRRRAPPPAPPTAEDELVAVELQIAELRLAQLKAEVTQWRVMVLWWSVKRVAFVAVLLWLLTTMFARAAEAGEFRQYFNSNGGYTGSSSRPGNGRFVNYYDRDGRYQGTELRRGGRR